MLNKLTNDELLAVWETWISRESNPKPEIAKNITEKLEKEIKDRLLFVPQPSGVKHDVVYVDPEDDYKPCTGDC